MNRRKSVESSFQAGIDVRGIAELLLDSQPAANTGQQ